MKTSKTHRWSRTLGLLAVVGLLGPTPSLPGKQPLAQGPGRLVLAEKFTSTV
jgi:hypothetical protein